MRAVLLAAALASLSLLAACGGGSQTNQIPQVVLLSIQVTGASGNLVVGQAQQMTATGSFSDKSTQDVTAAVSWSSSDTTVASISASGMLTANAAGTCTVTAKKGGISGAFNLTIAPALVSIAVTPPTATIAAATNQQFIATGTFTDGSKQNITGSVTWTSSSTGTATIATSSPTQGLAHGVASGNTTITATSGSISATATLTVTNSSATSITVTPANSSLPIGTAVQFTATAKFSDGSTQNVTDVATWSSSVTSVASITVSGLATGKNIGSTTISASFETVNGNTSLTVNVANLESISITPGNGSSAPGTNVFFVATGTFNDGSTRNLSQQVTWASTNTSVLSTPQTGAASCLTSGTVTVTATLSSVVGSTTFTVTNAKIVSISITPATATIPTGGHVHFTATGVFDDSSTADVTTTATWSSSNTAIATIGNASGSFGTALGVSAGNVTISAAFTANGATGTGSVPLTVDSGTLTGLTLQPGSTLIAPGSIVQYSAIGNFSDSSKESMNQYVSWSSSDNHIATVAAGGIATGQSAGTATITVQSGTISTTAALVVESSSLSLIQITPASSKDPVGINVQLRAIGTFANGDTQDLTTAVTWTSSASATATISNTLSSAGVATGVQPGTVTISAAFSGQVASASLTVTNATLSSIAVTPANTTMAVGESAQLTATGTFNDGSSITISNQATWTSSDPNFVTVSGSGVASSVASGTSTIKAALDGVSGTAIVTVQ